MSGRSFRQENPIGVFGRCITDKVIIPVLVIPWNSHNIATVTATNLLFPTRSIIFRVSHPVLTGCSDRRTRSEPILLNVIELFSKTSLQTEAAGECGWRCVNGILGRELCSSKGHFHIIDGMYSRFVKRPSTPSLRPFLCRNSLDYKFSTPSPAVYRNQNNLVLPFIGSVHTVRASQRIKLAPRVEMTVRGKASSFESTRQLSQPQSPCVSMSLEP